MFNLSTFDIEKFDSILARGLCKGMGTKGSQVCIEAAICETMGLPHSDEPDCVESTIRSFKIALNDQNWSTPESRAKGLRDLGLAQLGSKGIVSGRKFLSLLSTKLIQKLIPEVFRLVFTKNNELHKKCLESALNCENNPNKDNAYAAKAAAYAAYAADAAYTAAYAADAAYTATYDAPDYFLIMVANLATETLIELESPGCKLLGK